MHASLVAVPGQTSDTAADALSALCALEGLDSAAALQTFLSSRRTAIAQQLQAHNPDTPTMSTSNTSPLIIGHGNGVSPSKEVSKFAAASGGASAGVPDSSAGQHPPVGVALLLSSLAQSIQLTVSQVGWRSWLGCCQNEVGNAFCVDGDDSLIITGCSRFLMYENWAGYEKMQEVSERVMCPAPIQLCINFNS